MKIDYRRFLRMDLAYTGVGVVIVVAVKERKKLVKIC